MLNQYARKLRPNELTTADWLTLLRERRPSQHQNYTRIASPGWKTAVAVKIVGKEGGWYWARYAVAEGN